MIVKFFKTPTSIKPYATLEVYEDSLDEEISWIANILDCIEWETE